MMKKGKFLITLLLMLFIGIGTVKANTINSIKMDIYLQDNGDAIITEVWDTNLNSGTEGYHPYYNMNNSSIVNYTVKDDTGTTYTYNSNWNINNSFDTKKYTNGIYKTGNEVDLCWGISNYGKKTYTLTYTITNFIYNTADNYQVLYWQLIPSQLSSKPKTTYIKVHANTKFSDSLDVWGYGNYGGTCYVYDGYIEMQSDGELSSNEYMTMLVKFPANTFKTNNSLNKTFNELYNQAQEGSTTYVNNDENFFTPVISILVTFLPMLIIILVTIFATKNYGWSNLIKNKVIPGKNVLPFRDLPCKKDIFKAFLIASEYKLMKKDNDFLGSLLLKWIKDKNIEVTTEERGIFKNKHTKIIFIKEPEIINNSIKELEMYKMMVDASKDGILEDNEFSNYCNKHYQKVLDWFDEVKKEEFNLLKTNEPNLFTTYTKNTLFGPRDEIGASNELNQIASYMAGLKIFFKEFTQMHEKTAIEVNMWQEYLMYAQIFGMAKEVAKEFKEMYPDVITDNSYDTIILIHDFSYIGVNAASVARTRAQSYSAGGGGFSSGGGGGGSFGGGGGGGGFR